MPGLAWVFSILINSQTGDLKLAQKQLGHSNITTTGNIYTHVEEEGLDRAAEVLAELVKETCCKTVVRNVPGSDRVQ